VSALRLPFVKKRHAYTSEDVPWEIDAGRDGASSLLRYLRGGGIRAFAGPSSAREARARRQDRFLRLFVVLAALWTLFWFI